MKLLCLSLQVICCTTIGWLYSTLLWTPTTFMTAVSIIHYHCGYMQHNSWILNDDLNFARPKLELGNSLFIVAALLNNLILNGYEKRNKRIFPGDIWIIWLHSVEGKSLLWLESQKSGNLADLRPSSTSNMAASVSRSVSPTPTPTDTTTALLGSSWCETWVSTWLF